MLFFNPTGEVGLTTPAGEIGFRFVSLKIHCGAASTRESVPNVVHPVFSANVAN
jgi:hypothetical protein